MIINNLHYDRDGKHPIDHFDIEQGIHRTWSIVDDIKDIYYAMEDMTEDELMNALIGLAELSDVRFKNLWETYEQYLSNMHQQKLKEKEECLSTSSTLKQMDY